MAERFIAAVLKTAEGNTSAGSNPASSAKLLYMKQEDIKKLLCELEYEDVVLFENPSYDTAFIGVSSDNRAVYSYDKMAEHLMKVDGMDIEEAIEFIEYNTMRALPYCNNAPIVLVTSVEFMEEHLV